MVTRLPGGPRGRLLSAGAVVVGLAAVYGIGALGGPGTVGSSTQLGQASQAPVTQVTRACPGPGSGGVTSGSVAALALPGATTGTATTGTATTGTATTGTASTGTAQITRLTPDGSATAGATVTTLKTPGVLSSATVPAAPPPPAAPHLPASPPAGAGPGTAKKAAPGHSASPAASSSPVVTNPPPAVATNPGRGGVVVQAAGAMAQGLEVEQAGSDGLVTLPCPAPGTDFWFEGPGVSASPQVELYLMNTDSQPADAEVDVLTDSGPLLGASDTGIIVPPNSLVTQSLGGILHGSHALSLHVSTSVGRVAAAVRMTSGSGSPGAWLPPTQDPSTSLIIPGLPGTPGPVTLYLAVPGNANAQVKVAAVTGKGTYQPTGGSGIDLPGASAVSVQLPSLSGVAAALRVSANVPIVASAVISGGEGGAPGAIAPASGPVSQQGIASANPAGFAGSAQLVISAPGAAAIVEVTTATSKISLGGHAGTPVSVPAGHTVVVPVGPPPGGGSATFAVMVSPVGRSGPVYVGRVIRSGGTVRTIMPLNGNLTLVPLAPARDSLDAAGG